VRTQAERRSETRDRLLEAAATVFAERGVEGASVDAIAAAAGRTSGALYAHFGSKEGLLVELLDSWKNDVQEATSAEVLGATTADARLAALWRNFAEPPVDGGHRWVQLEHELWRWATRDGNDEAQERLGGRYRDAWAALAAGLDDWVAEGGIAPPGGTEGVAPLVVALLIGLEMQHRVDPERISDDLAVAGLRLLLGAHEAQGKDSA
jgi:AcrR family transcriptional regulator